MVNPDLLRGVIRLGCGRALVFIFQLWFAHPLLKSADALAHPFRQLRQPPRSKQEKDDD